MVLDPYKILKISRDAPDEVIRAAYKVLASKYHPDKNPGDEASARMMQHINDAYALLSNPIRRSEYDRKSTDDIESSAPEEQNSGSKRVTIHCRNCKRALRVTEDVLSAPGRFEITCPGCKKDPFAEPRHAQPSSEELRKSVINCKNCGQSIRVLSAVIQNPDHFDVVCPKCNLNPIPENKDLKYMQSTRSYNKSNYTIHPAIQKYNTLNIFGVFINFVKISFIGFVNFIKIAFFVIIFIVGILSFFEYLSKNNHSYDTNHRSTEKTATSQPAPAFSQPPQQLPQTGDNTASFINGAAPLTIKTSPSGGYHYFVKIVNATNHQELGSYFIRSGEILQVQVPVGTYEIKYSSGKQWYGIDYLFGPETKYNKADSLFSFNFDGYQYSGYTIELIMQQNGNLRTSGIQPSQW